MHMRHFFVAALMRNVSVPIGTPRTGCQEWDLVTVPQTYRLYCTDYYPGFEEPRGGWVGKDKQAMPDVDVGLSKVLEPKWPRQGFAFI